jgi:hypothetical protein
VEAGALVDVMPPVVLEPQIQAEAEVEQVAILHNPAVLVVRESSLFVGLHHN